MRSLVRFSYGLVALCMGVSSCKFAQTAKLASKETCSTAQLQKLEGEKHALEVKKQGLERMTPGSGNGTKEFGDGKSTAAQDVPTSKRQDDLIRIYATSVGLGGGQIIKAFKQEAGWRTQVSQHCTAYGAAKGQKQCEQDPQCSVAETWFGFPTGKKKIDQTLLLGFKTRNESDCKLQISAAIESKVPVPNQNGDEFNESTGKDDTFDSEMTKVTQQIESKAIEIKQCLDSQKGVSGGSKDDQKASTDKEAEDNVNGPSIFANRCEAECGKTVVSETMCTCPSGTIIDGTRDPANTKVSCSGDKDLEILCSRAGGTLLSGSTCVCSNSTDSATGVCGIAAFQCEKVTPTSTPDVKPTVKPTSNPTVAPPAVSESCTCSKVGDQCVMKKGSKSASLTVLSRNPTTGRAETCDSSGGGGFDNLCNQPQLQNVCK